MRGPEHTTWGWVAARPMATRLPRSAEGGGPGPFLPGPRSSHVGFWALRSGALVAAVLVVAGCGGSVDTSDRRGATHTAAGEETDPQGRRAGDTRSWRFVPATRAEGDSVVLPVTFTDGTSAELVYPRRLGIAALGVAPYGSATLRGKSPSRDGATRSVETSSSSTARFTTTWPGRAGPSRPRSLRSTKPPTASRSVSGTCRTPSRTTLAFNSGAGRCWFTTTRPTRSPGARR